MRLVAAFMAVMLGGAPLLAPSSASAQDTVEAAKARFRVGELAYRHGQYEEALREFTAGYELAPRPIFLLNIGQAQRKLGLVQAAVASFERYLAIIAPDDPTRIDVEILVASLRTRPTPARRQGSLRTDEPTPAVVTLRVAEHHRPDWVLPVALSVTGAVVLAIGLGVGLRYGVNRFDCGGAVGCVDLTRGAP